jgi:hypothetical protein
MRGTPAAGASWIGSGHEASIELGQIFCPFGDLVLADRRRMT